MNFFLRLIKQNNTFLKARLLRQLYFKSISDNPALYFSVKNALKTREVFLLANSTFNRQPLRWKSKKSRRRETEDEFSDDSDEEADEYVAGKGADIKTYVVGSMRLDLLIKMGLGLARNKVEEAFYESKIRINSKKVFKKSAHVQIGDEVDLIKGPAPNNPKFISVGRIEILHAKPRDDDSIEVKLRRSKQLVIENYPDGDPWRPSEVNST